MSRRCSEKHGDLTQPSQASEASWSSQELLSEAGVGAFLRHAKAKHDLKSLAGHKQKRAPVVSRWSGETSSVGLSTTLRAQSYEALE